MSAIIVSYVPGFGTLSVSAERYRQKQQRPYVTRSYIIMMLCSWFEGKRGEKPSHWKQYNKTELLMLMCALEDWEDTQARIKGMQHCSSCAYNRLPTCGMEEPQCCRILLDTVRCCMVPKLVGTVITASFFDEALQSSRLAG